MNKIYRVVWNKETNTWTAVCEYAKSKGKSSSSSGVVGTLSNGVFTAVRFTYTALVSALILVSGQAWAVTGNGSTTGDSKYCFYDATSQSVVCGDATTSTVDTVDGKQPKAVVMGIGATNAGESSIAIGATASSAGTASVAMGNAAKAGANQAVALGQNAQANGQWDISIGRQAGWGAKAPKATDPKGNEGRNIAFGDGALKNGLDVNNNTALGTSAGENLVGSHNIIMGSYSNTENAIASAVAAGSTEQQIGVKTREVDTVDNKKRQVKYIESNNSVAIGHRALATGAAGVAVGQQAKAFDATTVAVGNGTRAMGNNAVAMGNTANAGAGGAIAIGQQANYQPEIAENPQTGTPKILAAYKTTGANSIAIGVRTNATSNHSIAMGTEAKALAQGAVAVGSESNTSGVNATAIGQASEAKGKNSFAAGNDAHAVGTSAVAVGDGAGKGTMTIEEYKAGNYTNAASGDSSTAVGVYTKAKGAGSTAIGLSANAQTTRSVAVGAESSVAANQGIAIGDTAQVIEKGLEAIWDTVAQSYKTQEVASNGAIAIGNHAVAKGSGSVALGVNSKTEFMNSTAVGNEAKAMGYNSSAFGFQATAKGVSSVAIGDKALAGIQDDSNHVPSTNRGVAIGTNTNATGETAVALGSNAESKAHRGTALGVLSKATVNDGVALGAYSIANRNAGANGADPLSAKQASSDASVWTATHAAVSVGNDAAITNDPRQGATTKAGNFNIPKVTRQITGVAAGSQDTDAVNVAQLKAAGFVLATTADAQAGGTATDSTPTAATGATDKKIINGETLTLKAGKGVDLKQNGAEVTISTTLENADKTHYYSVKTTDTTATSNYNNDGAEGLDSLAAGVRTKAVKKNAVAVGSDAVAVGSESLAIGNNVIAGALLPKPNSSDPDKADTNVDVVGATAVGNNSRATATGAQAFGQSSKATAENAAAIGRLATASGARASAFGVGNTASGVSSFAGGDKSVATGANSIAVGLEAKSTHDNTIAIGKDAKAQIEDSIAIGRGVTTEILPADDALANNGVGNREGMIAIGSETTKASGKAAISIGRNAQGIGRGTVALGDASQSLAGQGVAIGAQANVANAAAGGIAIGSLAKSEKHVAIAIGSEAQAKGDKSVAVGSKAIVDSAKGVAVGYGAKAEGAETANIAIGDSAYTNASGALAIGIGASAKGLDVVTTNNQGVPTNDKAKPYNAIAIGNGANVDTLAAGANGVQERSTDAIAIGTNAKANYASTIAIGYGAKANTKSSATAIGLNSDAQGWKSLAVGVGAVAKQTDSVALGSDSVADTGINQIGADPLNAQADKNSHAWKSTKAAVSVGNAAGGITRQITSVAAGTQDTDAVNVAQLRAAGFKLTTSESDGVAVGSTEAKVKNGNTVTIDAGKNIKVTQTGSKVSIATKDDVEFSTVTTKDNAGNQTLLNGTGLTITPTGGNNPVSLTSTGLNNGGNKIVGVADGNIAQDSKEAVNGGQLFATNTKVDTNAANIAKGLNFAGNTGEFKRELGDKVTVSGGLADGKSASNSNIRTVANNGTIDIQIADAPVFTGKVTGHGFDANGQKITNVAKGDAANDAVNVAQLEKAINDAKVQSLTKVESNSPFSYINLNGDLLKRDVDSNGLVKYYKVNGGDEYTPTSDNDITITALNPKKTQTSVSVKVGNVSAGTDDKDAVNVSQLKDAVKALGGGAEIGADGSVTQPTYTVAGNTFNTVGGAIDKLDKEVAKPLTFVGDNAGEKVERKLGTELKVQGGADQAKLSENNIGVVGNTTDNSLAIKLAKDVNLGDDGSLTAGDSKVNNDGLTITKAGKQAVKLTSSGLDNGGNKIINVANGNVNANSTDAVNGSQLHATNTQIATVLGAGAAFNPATTTFTAPTYKVVDGAGNSVAGIADAHNVGDAFGNLNTYINKGFDVQGNGTTKGTVTPTEKINFVNGVGTTAVVSDEVNGVTNVAFDINAQGLSESAQLPVVYTNASGDKLYKHTDGEFYTQPNGGGQQVDPPNVIASIQNAAGQTTYPMTLTNVAAGKKINDAVNVGQLPFAYVNNRQEILTRTVDENGNVVFYKSDGTLYQGADISISALHPTNGQQVARATKIGNVDKGVYGTDAVNVSQLGDAGIYETTQNGDIVLENGAPKLKGLNFAGNDGKGNTKLGDTWSIVGGNAGTAPTDPRTFTDGTFSGGNIKTTVKDGVVEITMADSPKFGDIVINAPSEGVQGQPDYKAAGRITGVADGVDDKDVATVKQLKEKTATTSLTVTGNKVADLTDADKSKLATAGDIANAINNTGFTLTTAKTADGELGANATNELIKAGDSVTVEADNNIKLTQVNGKISIATKKDVKFDSVTAGEGDNQVVLNNEGVKSGNTTVNNDGITIKAPANGGTTDVKLTANGLNNGGNKITNVAKGTSDTDAVNVGQLNEQLTATEKTTTAKAGSDKVTVQGTTTGNNTDYVIDLADSTKNSLAKADSALQGIQVNANGTAVTTLDKDNNTLDITQGDNITVSNDGGKVKVALNQDVTGLNSLTSKTITAGEGTNQVILDNTGVNFGGNTYISDAGLNANNKKVTNVANGDITATSKDAINGSQLYAVSTAIKNLMGGNANVDDAGNVTVSDIGGTGQSNIHDAIKTVKTTVKSTDNSIKVTANPADATNGTVFDISVNAQGLAESAQLPVVYTKADGTKVYKVGNKFFDNKEGTGTEIEATNIIASMQNADGTITPTTLANIKAGTKDTDAVNVSQLKGVADTLGGNASINADGTINAPTYNITNPADGAVIKAQNVGDALNALNTAVNNPLTFAGDTGLFNRNLGQTTTIKGGVTDENKLSNSNIGVVAKDGTLDIKLAKDIAIDSVSTGNTTVNNDGVTIKAPANGGTTDVKLTANGLNNGGNKITNVAKGTVDTDAVNFAQLKEVQKTAKAAKTEVQAGNNMAVTYSTGADGQTIYNVATKPDVLFDSVTVGTTGTNQVVLDDTGVKVGGNTYISGTGLNANNKKVTNVAKGDVSANSKDTINGSQLYAHGEGVKNIIGGSTTYDPATGAYTNADIGGTGKGNIHDAIASINTTANAGWNVQTNAGNKTNVKPSDTVNFIDGSNIKITNDGTNITVATADDLTVNSVTAGNTVVNNAGVKVGDVQITAGGINAGNQQITNLKSGLNGKTLDDIKADTSAPERSNAATIGDLATVQNNVTNITHNYNTVIGGSSADGKALDSQGNVVTDNQGNSIDVADALKTYNVQDNKAKTDNTIITAIKNMNEGGIKFFHVNDGTGEQNIAGTDTHKEDSTASGKFAAAVGYEAQSTGENALAFGKGSQALAKNAIAIGTGNIVRGENSGAIGDPSIINGANSYSVGNNNTVTTDKTFVLGNEVKQTVANSVFLGDKSSSAGIHTKAKGEHYTYAGANDDNVVGVSGRTAPVGVVSVGTEGGQTRQIQNVAAGVVSANSTDAINGSQLYYTNEAITNVANNTINMGNQLNNRINDVADDANAGVSSAMAMASLPQAYLPGKSMITGGVASYNGKGAVAVGLSKLSDNGRWVLKISGSADTQGNAGGSIGAGFHF